MSIEEEPQKKTGWLTPGKLIAITAAMILLGIGLCSLGGFNLEGSDTHPFLVGLGTASFWIGLIAFFVGLFWGLVTLITGK